MFRTRAKDITAFPGLKLHFPDMEISEFVVNPDSGFENKTLRELALRTEYGATILAVKRNEQIISNPSGETELKADDLLFVLIEHKDLNRLREIFDKR